MATDANDPSTETPEPADTGSETNRPAIPRDVATGLVVIGIGVALCGVIRIVGLVVLGKWDEAFNHESILWFLLAGVLVVLPWISKFKFDKDGSIEFELAAQRKEVAKVKQDLVATQQTAIGAMKTANVLKSASGIVVQEDRFRTAVSRLGGISALTASVDGDSGEPGGDADDPLRGHWGGTAEANGWKLSCGRVRAITGSNDFFRVPLKLKAVDPAKKDHEGTVRFHLHPTFHPDVEEVEIDKGHARLELLSYGAFTIGAEIDDGTRLELNLADEDVKAPERFKIS
jgi:hypothetical protein